MKAAKRLMIAPQELKKATAQVGYVSIMLRGCDSLAETGVLGGI